MPMTMRRAVLEELVQALLAVSGRQQVLPQICCPVVLAGIHQYVGGREDDVITGQISERRTEPNVPKLPLLSLVARCGVAEEFLARDQLSQPNA